MGRVRWIRGAGIDPDILRRVKPLRQERILRFTRKNIIGENAAVGQFNPALLIAAVIAQLGIGRGPPSIGRWAVDKCLRSIEPTGEYVAVGQNLNRIVAKLGRRTRGAPVRLVQ